MVLREKRDEAAHSRQEMRSSAPSSRRTPNNYSRSRKLEPISAFLLIGS